MVSHIASLVREQRTLSDDEVARLKGADFHAVLFNRLRDTEAVGEPRLLELAKSRGEAIVSGLRSAGVAAERIVLGEPEKLEGDITGLDIPVKLIAKTVRKGTG